jgi:hypothetical protein
VLVGLFSCGVSEKELQGPASRNSIGKKLPATVFRPAINKQLAFRVVVLMTTSPPPPPVGGLKYFVLMEINHKSNLWYPNLIAQDVVFFFHEYRSGCTSLIERRTIWSGKVTAVSVTNPSKNNNEIRHTSYIGSDTDHELTRLHL